MAHALFDSVAFALSIDIFQNNVMRFDATDETIGNILPFLKAEQLRAELVSLDLTNT